MIKDIFMIFMKMFLIHYIWNDIENQISSLQKTVKKPVYV